MFYKSIVQFILLCFLIHYLVVTNEYLIGLKFKMIFYLVDKPVHLPSTDKQLTTDPMKIREV